MKSLPLRGIVYFDIDDTLTTMKPDDKESIIIECLQNGFGVGIITASDRPIDYVCVHDKANKLMSPWMPHALCEWMSIRNFDTYNSMSLTAGEKIKFPYFDSYGGKKGWQLEHGRKLFGVDTTILFDDNSEVIREAMFYSPKSLYVHIDNANSDKQLDLELIQNIIEKYRVFKSEL